MINLRSLRLVIAIVVLGGCLSAVLQAQAPNVISYSGTLTDAQGQPTDGPLNLTFRLYDSPLGGPLEPASCPAPPQPCPLLHKQTIPQVPVRKGQFTVVLGPFNDPNVFVQGAGER